MKKVTLKDIAKELNVTVGTVSHVLNGVDDISEETRQKVLDAAKRLGYITNASAAALRLGKTYTIAVIVPDISNPHIAHQIKLLEDKMRALNYSVIILNTNEDEAVEYRAIISACSKQVDGILLCPCQHSTKNVEFLKSLEIPFALIGRFFADLDVDYVCADDIKGGYLAGKALLEKGCRNPLYIGTYKYIEGSQNRFEGLKKAFEEEGIVLEESRFLEMSPMGVVSEAIVKKIRKQELYDSVVAFSDVIAFKIMSQMTDIQRKHIPVIGFDGIASHLYLPFGFTSVRMAGNGWAEKASEIIMKKMEGSKEKFQELIDVTIFE